MNASTISAMVNAGSPTDGAFMFATGIECSYPTIMGCDCQRCRIDELAKCFHYQRYQRWREDLRLVRELGIRYLRYGPPSYRMHSGPHVYDWSFVDEVVAEMRRLGIEPIADLCHFGVPDWIRDFQNPDWAPHFAEYAGAFARRYPWIRLYTPVNEIYVCAKLSALHGLWNERVRSEEAFVTAIKHMCRANLLAIKAIQHERPDACSIQSESAEYFHEGCQEPDMVALADFENQRRFLSFDLLYSHPVRDDIRAYLRRCGLDDAEYAWFMNHGLSDRIIMGNDFYRRNEQIVMPSGQIEPAGDVVGWYIITRQYYQRYRRPVMHTETNNIGTGEAEAPRWLWKQFLNMRLMHSEGIFVLGFTWYSLTDQMDWDVGLADERNVINPVGLYDMDRRPRPVAAAYKRMIQEFAPQLSAPQLHSEEDLLSKHQQHTYGRPEIVVVTGASAGIGRATALAFARRGAHIGLLARGQAGLEAARQEVEALGGKALVLPTDVADPDQVERAAAAVEEAFGPIDVWVNNAMTSVFSPVKEMMPEEFRRVTEVTYLGYVYGTLAALRRMLPRDHGTIVQVGSALAYRGIPLQAAYCGAKHAIQGFCDSLRAELIHDGSNVRLTMVQLPGINTPQFDWVKSRLPQRARPIGAVYQPEVPAEAIVWAAHHDRREIYVGLPAAIAIVGNKLAPGLGDWYLGKTGYAGQQTGEPADPDRAHNLWEPVDTEQDHGAHGRFGQEARTWSPQLWATTHRRWLAVAGASVAAVVGTMIGRRKA